MAATIARDQKLQFSFHTLSQEYIPHKFLIAANVTYSAT